MAHASPEKERWMNDENEVQFTLMIPVEDRDNEKMKMEERLHWCYSTNPAWRTSENAVKMEWAITNEIWCVKIPKITGSPDQWDLE